MINLDDLKREVINDFGSEDKHFKDGQNMFADFFYYLASRGYIPQWYPIETAPKDKWLLLGYYNIAGKWRCVRGQWFSAETIAEDWTEFEGDPVEAAGFYETVENIDEIPNCWKITPTHWMPLPKPPTKE